MDLKTDELINVEIDLSSELEKLSLGNIPKDFLDKISKFDQQPDIETIFLPVEEHKIEPSGEVFCKEFKSSQIKTCLSDDKLCINDAKEKASVDKSDVRKDINGNDSFPDENLDNLIIKYENLELSDSDNEEDEEDDPKLTERGGPDRRAAQRRRSREPNYLARRDTYDRSQFNSNTLRHLSGSCHVQQMEITPVINQLLHEVDFSNILNQTSSLPFDFSFVSNSDNSITSQNAIAIPAPQNSSSYGNFRLSLLNNSTVSLNETIVSVSCNSDSLYDSAPNSLNSPESGYDTSYSITGSPPQNLASPECSLDLNAEKDIDQEVIDIVLDFEFENPPHSVSTTHNLISLDLDSENHKEKIIDFLKDIPPVQNELPHTTSEASSEYVNTELNQLPHIASLDPGNNSVETELIVLPASAASSEVNSEHVPAELNDLLSTPSSKTSYEQVLKELNNLSTITSTEANVEHVFREPNDLPPVGSYAVSCENLPKEQRNLSLVASSGVVPLVTNPAVTDSFTPIVPLVLCQSTTQNNSGTRLACKPLENRAKNLLRKFLSKERFYAAQDAIYKKVNEDMQRKKKVKVIYIEDEEDDKTSEKQTNLHKAVINKNIEEVYCLVEINKQYADSDPFGNLNLRDKQNKTALDYAVEKGLKILVDYLKENNACQSLHI